MKRRQQVRFPAHQQPLSDRIHLAAGARPAWQPDATWQEWEYWLRSLTIAVWRTLRRAAEGHESFRSLEALANLHHSTHQTLSTILDELAFLHLIDLLRRASGSIITIAVGDPPPVPVGIEAILRRLSFNRPPARRADVQDFLDYWCPTYEQTRGVPYHLRPGDRGHVRAALAAYGLAELKHIAWWTLVDPDHRIEEEMIRKREITVRSFAARLPVLAPACHRATETRRILTAIKEKEKAKQARWAAEGQPVPRPAPDLNRSILPSLPVLKHPPRPRKVIDPETRAVDVEP